MPKHTPTFAKCATPQGCGCGHRHFLSPSKAFAQVKASRIPEGGWNDENFRSREGAALLRDMLLAQRLAKLKGARKLAPALVALFRAQVKEVVDTFQSKLFRSYGRLGVEGIAGVKAVHTITVTQHADLWASAIEEAFAKEGLSVTAVVKPTVQSVADDVLERTTLLTAGRKPTDAARRVMKTQVNELANDVTAINETTRRRLARVLAKEIDAGKTPFEVMETVRKKVPEIATYRVPTIVRTEMGRAADRAVLTGMKDSGVVTHVSVTGCEAIEKGIPTWNGIPTCNIRNVPIANAGELRFHPNHTGAIVASAFRKQDGGVPVLPTRGGEGIGTWEDRDKPVPAIVRDSPPKPTAPPTPPPPPQAPPTPPVAPKPPKPPKPAPTATVAPSPALPTAPKPPQAVIPAPVAPAAPPLPTALGSDIPAAPAILPPAPAGKPPVSVAVENIFDTLAATPEARALRDGVRLALSEEDIILAYREAGEAVLRRDLPRNGSRGLYLARRKMGDVAPTFVSAVEFEKALEESPVGLLGRGVTVSDPLDNLARDDRYWGTGIYGDGYYHIKAEVENITWADMQANKFPHTARSYAHVHTGCIMAGCLRKEAKLVTSYEIREKFREWRNSLVDNQPLSVDQYIYKIRGLDPFQVTSSDRARLALEFERLNEMVDAAVNNIDEGAFARLMGYDAIVAADGDYIVVVNNRHYVLFNQVARYNRAADDWRFELAD